MKAWRFQYMAIINLEGAMAARLWWMLRWLGREAVAVLDGGWPRWQQAGYRVRSGEEGRPARHFTPDLRSLC